MEAVVGSSFIGKEGEKLAIGDIEKAEVFGVYFSAHWCPPCRAFTPQLAEVYEKINASGKRFEVVFVSSDRNEEDLAAYFADMPWVAIPFGDARIQELMTKFDVKGIPTLVILNKSGELITSDGRTDVQSKGAEAIASWVS